MGDKVFKTYDEQISILESRGMDLLDKNERQNAKKLIQRIGYYKLINGYKTPFLDATASTETYLPGTRISELYALYVFDRSLREIFLRYILRVETNVKTLISYTISSNYGHDNYLLYKNFNTSKREAAKEISGVIADLNQAISKNSNDPCIRHYLQNYGYVPMWVLNNVLTLGNISRLYSIMKTNDRQSISRVFKINDDVLENFLHLLSIVRNFSAHGNRLYCIRTRRPLINTNAHTFLSIPKSASNEYILGKRDLFAAVIVLRHLMSLQEYKKFNAELTGAINNLSSKLNVISVDDILSNMGFPSNWKDLRKGIKIK
uniref:Abi-like protein n=1 Tax=Siphoviridae sp. ctkKt3 TaxID=2825642 RepID=A0A8S5UYY3_9CAUD|nr:MAG TPA: Abi-like protein [Siphoviridae sp. ctkKt3]